MSGLSVRLPQRLLALTILLALAGLAWVVIGQPLAAVLFRADDDTARALQLVAAFQRKAGERPALEARLRALQAREAGLPGLLDGPTVAAAAANLQTDMKKIVESAHGDIRTAQNRPPSTVEGFEKIEIRYDLSAPMSALDELLYRIETHQPYLLLDDINIGAPENWTADAAGGGNPKLSIRFAVDGYRRTGAP